MGENSKIIIVANQKGGVGKSTICMALANYLAFSKMRIGGIIDTDFQQSIVKRRKSDLERIKGTDIFPAFEVTSYNLDNFKSIPNLIEELRKTDSIYIFDTPGMLNHQGIVCLLAMADYIIIPFSYDAMDLSATAHFLRFWTNLQHEMQISHNATLEPQLFFIPMKLDMRIGTKSEKELWETAKEAFEKRGIVTSSIKYGAEMKRCDTISLNPLQVSLVKPAISAIVNHYYGIEPEILENDGSEDTES